MPSLDELRNHIDRIDDQLVSLLNQRAELVLQVKETKQRQKIDIYSASRER